MNELEDRVSVVNVALSNTNALASFGLPTIDNSGTGSIVPLGAHDHVFVETKTLDAVLEEMKVLNVDFIKLDIQGAELMALKGAVKTLESRPILVIELWEVGMKAAGYTAKEVLDFLRPFGYRCYEFTRRGLCEASNPKAIIENYCFLTEEHLERSDIRGLTQ